MSPLRVAACHASPVFLNATRTTDKAISLMVEAAKNDARLVVFPESFIPAFPFWSAVRAPAENHDLFKRMAAESVHADGEHIGAIQEAARSNKIRVSIGVSEKGRQSAATLFNSNFIIGDEGKILVHHRKLVATFFEKLTWSAGDGHGLRVASTPFGNVGNLICGENTNPLARYSLMAQGEELHISTWPAIWPTRFLHDSADVSESASDSEEVQQSGAKNYDNVAANRTRAAAHCFEAKCFGVLCSGHLAEDAIDATVAGSSSPSIVRSTLTRSTRGATMYLDPAGGLLPGFVIDRSSGKRQTVDHLQNEEGILYADLNLEDCIEGKQYHDVVGGYQRLDVFQLQVNRHRHEPVQFHDAVAREESKQMPGRNHGSTLESSDSRTL